MPAKPRLQSSRSSRRTAASARFLQLACLLTLAIAAHSASAQFPVIVNADSSYEGIARADQTPLPTGLYRVGWFDGLTPAQITGLAAGGNQAALEAAFREIFSFTDLSGFGAGLPFESRVIVAAGDAAGLAAYRNATSNATNPLQSAAGETVYVWILDGTAGPGGSATAQAIVTSSVIYASAIAIDGSDYETNFSTGSDTPGVTTLAGSIANVSPGSGVDTNGGSASDGVGLNGGTKVLLLAEIPGTGSAVLSLANATLSVAETAGSIQIPVVRSGSKTSAVSVSHATANGTAQAAIDYTSTNGTTNIAASATNGTVTVPIANRPGFQGNRTFNVTISNPQAVTGNVSLGNTTTTTVTIVESSAPAPGQLALSNATYSTAENGGSLNITVQRTGGSDGTANVTLSTANGSASGPGDFTPVNTVVAFLNGETSKNISITIGNDAVFEGNETFTVGLSNATFQHPGGSIGAPSGATVTIVEDDLPPGILAFGNASYSTLEANAGTTNVIIPVLRTGGAGGNVSVQFATANGTAQSGSDYVAQSGTLNFANGVTSANLTLVVNGDATFEGNETFTVTLSNATGGASLGAPNPATVTIINDDAAPAAGSLQFSSANYSVGEGNTTFTVSVTRTDGTFGNVTVNCTASNGTASGGSDFTPVATTLSFLDGQTSRTFDVTILDDLVFEGDETVNLALANPTGSAALGQPQNAVLTITENDAPGNFRFSMANYTASEDGGNVTLTVERTGGDDGTVTVNYTTSDGSGTAGADYTPSAGTLTFNNGQTSKTFQIQVLNNQQFTDPSRTVNLALANPTAGAGLGTPATAVLTITEDDQPGDFRYSAANYSVSENGVSAIITVTRTGGSGGTATVNYATDDGTALAGVEYTAVNGTLTFVNGDTSETFSVPVADDLMFDGNKSVLLSLSDPSAGSSLTTPSSATLIITDNEARQAGTLALATDTFAVAENAGTATIVVQRIGGTDGQVTVDYRTVNGTASSATDYGATNGTLTFENGENQKSFTIPITNDTVVESDETVTVQLMNVGGGATLGSPAQGTLTITNDDQPVKLRLSSATYNGTEGGTVNIVVERENGLDQTISVRLYTQDGSARAGQDYSAVSRNLVFGPDETSQTVSISITDDLLAEPQETFTVYLQGSGGGTATKKKKGGSGNGTGNTTTDAFVIKSPNPATVFIARSDATEQPDMQAAAPGSSTFFGNNIYNSDGSNQIAVANIARGGSATFQLKLQNDGTAMDSFLLKGTASFSTRFTATYRSGSTDITEAVLAGTYPVNNLAAGASRIFTVQLKASSAASQFEGSNVGLTATSVVTPSKTDTARGAVIITR